MAVQMGVNDVVGGAAAGGENKAAVAEDSQWDMRAALDFDKKNETSSCNDPLWLVLWLVQFLFFMYLGIDAIAWFGADSDIRGPPCAVNHNMQGAGNLQAGCTGPFKSNIKVITDFLGMPEKEMLNMTSSCGIGLVIVMFYSIGWLYAMRAVEGKVIYTSVVVLLVIQWVVPILFGSEPNVQFYAIYDIIMFLVIWWCRSSIPLVEAVLANALQVLHENWAPIGISYIFVFLSAAIQGIYIFAFISLLLKAVGTDYKVSEVELIAFYISYCWTKNVMQGIVHFTIAGVVASWALLGSDAPAPTMGALKRSITSSFGSICYSGLVVAIAQNVESILKTICCAPRYTCPCLVSCCFDWIANMIRMYNVYTLSECAVFGCSYCEGVTRFNDVFCNKGMDVVTLCVLTVIPFTVAANAGFWIIIGLIMAFLNDVTVNTVGMYIFLIVMVFAMYIFGNNIVYATICMVESAIATVFIVWSEDPEGFAKSQPDQFKKIADAAQADAGVIAAFEEKGGFPASLKGVATN